MQLPFEPPWPPGFFPPPSGLLDFVLLYLLFVEIMLLALPRKWGKWALETLFSVLRRLLFSCPILPTRDWLRP